jgi:peptide/nickel transport system permease protein
MRELTAIATRRLLLLALTVVCAAAFSTLLVRLAPGFGMDERQLDLRIARRAAEPAPDAWRYLAALLHGRWGDSLSLHRPVAEVVAERAVLTLRTLVTGLTAAWTVSALCCIAAIWARYFDWTIAMLSSGLLCLPAAVVALLAMHLDAGPSIALAAILLPRIIRYLRNVLAAGSERPHVLAARSRGAGRGALVLRHMCLPAAPELLALGGVSVSMAAGAIIPVEVLCDSPGLGQLVWQGAIARDLPVLAPLTMLAAAAVCAANLAADTGRALVCRWT